MMTFAIVMAALIGSCTETEIIPFEKGPANRITTYKVTNATEVLYGVVDDIDNTITVSVPYYLGINFIVPEITLEEGAALIDTQGNPIDIREDLEPVPFDSDGYTYRVKDSGNTVREYTLITRILPHKDPLKMGYTIRYTDGIPTVDDTARKEALINARIAIYGNLESSSMNARLTLIDRQTNPIVPNGLQLNNVASGADFYTVRMDVSPEVDAGDYEIVIQHQGRTDTLPPIQLNYKKPYFGQLPKVVAHGDTITMPVSGPNSNGEVYSGVNTGVTRAYLLLDKELLPIRPGNFPDALSGQPVELEILSQNRTEIKFRFPDVIPAGIYVSNQSLGASTYEGYGIGYTGFGVYFDFEDEAWGKDNLLGTTPYLNFEVKTKQ